MFILNFYLICNNSGARVTIRSAPLKFQERPIYYCARNEEDFAGDTLLDCLPCSTCASFIFQLPTYSQKSMHNFICDVAAMLRDDCATPFSGNFAQLLSYVTSTMPEYCHSCLHSDIGALPFGDDYLKRHHALQLRPILRRELCRRHAPNTLYARDFHTSAPALQPPPVQPAPLQRQADSSHLL